MDQRECGLSDHSENSSISTRDMEIIAWKNLHKSQEHERQWIGDVLRDIRCTAPLDAEGNTVVDIPMAEGPTMIDVSSDTSAAAVQILRRQASDDTPPAIETESCGSIVAGFPGQLEARQGQGNHRVAEDPPVVFPASINSSSDTGNASLYETQELSRISLVESPDGVSPINARNPPDSKSFSERYSPYTPRPFRQEHARHCGSNGLCTGLESSLGSGPSRRSPLDCAHAVSSASYPVGIVRTKLKHGAEEKINWRQTTEQNIRCRRHGGDNNTELAHVVSAGTPVNKSIMNANGCESRDIGCCSYCAKGVSVTGCFALALVAVTAFAAGAIYSPSLRRQAPPVSTPRAYTRQTNNVNLTNKPKQNNQNLDFRWQRPSKLATAAMSTRWRGQRSFITEESGTLEAQSCVASATTIACGNTEHGAAVATPHGAARRSLLWSEKATCKKQARTDSHRKVNVRNFSWTWRQPLLSRPRDVTSVDECPQVGFALQVPFTVNEHSREQEKEGEKKKRGLPRTGIFSRSQSGGHSFRHDEYRTSGETEYRDYSYDEDEVEIKPPAKLIVGMATRGAFARTFGFSEQQLDVFGSREVQDIVLGIRDDLVWRGTSSESVARWACNAMVSCGGFYNHGECSRCARWLDAVQREGAASVTGAALQRVTATTAEGSSYAVSLRLAVVALLGEALQLVGLKRTSPNLLRSEQQGTQGSTQQKEQADDKRSHPQCSRLVVTGYDLPAHMSGYYHLLIAGESPTPGVQHPSSHQFNLGSMSDYPSLYYCQASPQFAAATTTIEADYVVQMEAFSQRTEFARTEWENRRDSCDVDNFMSVLSAQQDREATRACQAGSLPPDNDDQFIPQTKHDSKHGATGEGRHCIYWANVGGGRWVLDDDLSISNGVLAMTAEVASEIASVTFGWSSHARNDLRHADVVSGEERNGVGSTPSTASTSRWLLDSPRLQAWVAAESVDVVCDVA